MGVEEVLPADGPASASLTRPRRALKVAGDGDDMKPHAHLTLRLVAGPGQGKAAADELRDSVASGRLAADLRSRGVPAARVTLRALVRSSTRGPLADEALTTAGAGGGLSRSAVGGLVAALAAAAAALAVLVLFAVRTWRAGREAPSVKAAAAPAPSPGKRAAGLPSPFDVGRAPSARPATAPCAPIAELPSESSGSTSADGSARGWPMLSPPPPAAAFRAGAPTAAADDNDVPFAELTLLAVVGEGSYGRVHLAKWRETTVAVKVLTGAAGPATLASLRREAAIGASLRHPNVLQFLGAVVAPPAVVTEYCRHGSVADALTRAAVAAAGLPPPPGGPPDPDADSIAAAVAGWRTRLGLALGAAKGVLYLHTRSPPVLHRDLKAANLLIGAGMTAKVADFNLARLEAAAPSGGSSAGAAVNPRWTAPEVLAGAPPSPAADVYAFGVLLWELAAWDTPWRGAGHWHVALSAARGERPPLPGDLASLPGGAPADASGYVALMRACWSHEAGARPGFGAVIASLRSLAAAQAAAAAPA